MFKMVVKKTVLRLGVVLALCAFVVPSVVSAASWAPVGTTDGRIDSANFGFSIPAINSGTSCAATTFSVTVDTAALATITGASFVNCNGDVGLAKGCTVTVVGTDMPWAGTVIPGAAGTHFMQFHEVDIDIHFETKPGTLNECGNNGVQIQVTGTAFSVTFTPNAVGLRRFDFEGSSGLVAHVSGINFPATLRGSGTPTGLLNVID
ncbi:MAG: hypothetical protein ABW167_13375 [Baekduia sp.]